jgi:uncharacterized protein (TIGR01619 family)
MDNDWDVYISELNGLPASFFLNLAARPDGDSVLRPYVCRLDLNLAAPSEDGLTTKEESEKLLELEDGLSEAFSISHNGAFVGRVTHDGKRRFFFYLTKADGVEGVIRHSLQSFEGYGWSHTIESDPDWRHFFDFLYPAPEEMQVIQNQRVLDALEEAGDLNHIVRRVDHWLYFPDREAMEKFEGQSMPPNFKIEEESINDGQWKLRISRDDCVEFSHINDLTLELYGLAVESGGDYGGWETPVIRN